MNMKKIFSFLMLVVLTSVIFSGCYYDNQEDLYPKSSCDVTNVTYTGNVLSIIQSNCFSCHSAAANNGNVNLEGYANLKTYADNGKLAGVIEHKAGFSAMPQGAVKLSECNISIIKTWILSGSGNN